MIVIEKLSSLTALDVAKSEYLHVFGNGDKRASSALSNYTIRPVDSFASLASVYFRSESPTDSSSICSTHQFDIDNTIHRLLTSLRVTSPSSHHRNHHSTEHINYLKTNLEQMTHQCHQIIQHFRGQINEATKVVDDLQKNADKIDTMRDVVEVATQDKLILRSISPKKRHRESEDSQLTVVSHPQTWASDHNIPGHTSTATQTTMMDHFFAYSIPPSPPTWLDQFVRYPGSPTYKTSPSKIATKFKQLAKKKRRLEDKIFDLQLEASLEKQYSSSTNTCRVKTWLKRMVAPVHSPLKLEIVFDIDENNCFVGHEVKHMQGPPTTCGDAIDASIDNALRTSQVVLEAVRRDLGSIKTSLVAVKFYFSFLLGSTILILFFSFRQNSLSTWRITP